MRQDEGGFNWLGGSERGTRSSGGAHPVWPWVAKLDLNGCLPSGNSRTDILEVLYSGGAPGLVTAVTQINIRLPMTSANVRWPWTARFHPRSYT